MSGSIPKAIIPTPLPRAFDFLKMLDQIPRYMGRFQGQMPHWLGLKSQKFHNLSGIVERIAKEIFGSQSTEQGLKSQDKNYASMNPMDPKSLRTCAGDFIAGLQVTSRRPCWWSKTKEFLSAGK